MNAIAEYDFSNLRDKVSGFTEALLGNGAELGDLQRMLMTETGQLAGRMGDAVGPKTKDDAQRKIDRDVNRHLTSLPRYSVFTDEDQRNSSKYAEFTWLTAGPNYLLGINDEDNQLGASGEDAYKMLRVAQKGRDRGDAYQKLGRRGKQAVMRLNKVRVSAAALKFVRAKLAGKSGELRAAFYAIAARYVPSKRIPAWIRAKFPQVEASGKSSFNESNLRVKEFASLEFTIRAPGVTSNPGLVQKFNGALEQSAHILAAKTDKILAGFKYDWETGKVFRRRSDDFSDN